MESAETFVANLNATILNPLIVLLFALASLYLVFGLFMFVANSSNDEARSKGKRHIMYAIVGLFIMLSATALIRIVLNTFGINSNI